MSVRVEQLASRWADFLLNLVFELFSKIYSENASLIKTLVRISGPLCEDQYKLMIISPFSFLLRVRNVSDEIVKKIQTHILCSITFFFRMSFIL
jgi:hypothetical protein